MDGDSLDGARGPRSTPVLDLDAEVARAESLIGAGRLLEAVDVLADVVRARPDPAIEERLIGLRFDAVPPSPEGSGEWPPVVADLFEGVDGVPEIRADELTAARLASAIVHHGSLLVRGLVSPERAAQLREDADRAFEARQRASDGAPVEETSPWYVPCRKGKGGHEAFGQANHVRLVDTPRGFAHLTEAFRESGLAEVVTEVLGERPALSTHKANLRRVPATGPGAPQPGLEYHQDGAFMGTGIRTVNVWLALSPCGKDAASLDFVPRRIDHVVPPGTDGARLAWMLSPSTVDRIAGEGGVVRPDFEPGDALLFDELLVHRTGISHEMTEPRYASESWLFAPSAYPDDHVPVIL